MMDINNNKRDFDRLTLLIKLSEKIYVNKDILKSINILVEEKDFYKEDILYNVFDVFNYNLVKPYCRIKHLGAIDEYFDGFKNLNDDEFLKEIQITINYIINAHLMVYLSTRRHMTFFNYGRYSCMDREQNIYNILLIDLENFCIRFKENPLYNKGVYYISKDELKEELYIKVNVVCYNLIMLERSNFIYDGESEISKIYRTIDLQ